MKYFFHIETHLRKVNDLSFSHQNRKLCIITCGEDKAVKVYLACSLGIKTTLDCICESSFLCRCGMLSLVISCILLKGIKNQLTPCALIIRKTFMYAVVLFAILLVDSFFYFFLFLLFMRDFQGLFLMPQPEF